MPAIPAASLPTAIGLPPPPIATMPSHGAPRVRSVTPPALPSVKPQPGKDVPSDELSGSDLLEEVRADAPKAQPLPRLYVPTPAEPLRAVSAGAGGQANDAQGLPPPTDPVLHNISQEEPVEVIDPSARPGLSLILEDIAEIRSGRPPKNKAIFAAVVMIAVSFFILIIAGITSLARGPSREARAHAPEGSAPLSTARPVPVLVPAPTASSSTAVAAASPTKDEPTTGAVLGACATSGEAKSIAPRAVITSGIEAQAIGGGLALGFASAAREAVATMLDPSTLTPTATVRTRPTGGDARHVTPMLISGKLTAMPDVERKGDRLGSRRAVSASTLIDIGTADGTIAWAPHGKDSIAHLFELDGDGAVEALHTIALTDRKGIAVAFRRGNAIHFGAARGDGVLDAEGALSKIAGLGQVGSPTLAESGNRLIVAWADRATAQDDWQVRFTKVTVGGTADDATSFAIPDGGLGSQAMSPSVAPLGGGRFLLAWTEGPVSNHQVRAITIGADGAPSGLPLAISAAGINAGQPSAVVGPDGRGAVAFLAARGKALEVLATPISCPPR
jgi:hypothetical protein